MSMLVTACRSFTYDVPPTIPTGASPVVWYTGALPRSRLCMRDGRRATRGDPRQPGQALLRAKPPKGGDAESRSFGDLTDRHAGRAASESTITVGAGGFLFTLFAKEWGSGQRSKRTETEASGLD